MLSKFLKYSKDYHKIILILTVLMLLFIFFEKNFQFEPIRIHIPYLFSWVFTFEFLNKIAHIFFGGLVFLFFYLSIGFFSQNLSNINLKNRVTYHFYCIGFHIKLSDRYIFYDTLYRLRLCT